MASMLIYPVNLDEASGLQDELCTNKRTAAGGVGSSRSGLTCVGMNPRWGVGYVCRTRM